MSGNIESPTPTPPTPPRNETTTRGELPEHLRQAKHTARMVANIVAACGALVIVYALWLVWAPLGCLAVGVGLVWVAAAIGRDTQREDYPRC